MEENNNELAIEMPALKSEQTQAAPTYQNTNEDVSSPVLSETKEDPIIAPVSEPAPVVLESSVVENETSVETPVVPVVETPAIEMPVVPETPEVPVAIPETPVAVESTATESVDNVVNEDNPVEPVAPVAEPEVAPINEPVVASVEVVAQPAPAVEIPVEPASVPVEPVVAPVSDNVQTTEEPKEPEIKKASKKAQIIGTVVMLVITALIVFWIAKRYFVL